jgi:PAS domain S-box-containing protein
MIILADDASIESLNTAATKMFGYQTEELAGRSLAVLAPDSEVKLAEKDSSPTPFADSMLNRHYEMKGSRKDGTVFPLEISLSKMIFGPKLFYIVMARDITEEKIRKTEALQAGKLAAIGELAAGVAHEINNPINGIINYAQIIRDDQQDTGDPEHVDLLKRIIKEGERVAGIVSNLLAFARQRDEHIDEINLSEVINDSISLMSHQFSKEGVATIINIPDNMPPLRGNPQQLQQVFLNLLSNAKYALNERFPGRDPDKKIEISSQVIDWSGEKFIRTILIDHGCGIEPDVISKVFDSMFSTKPAGKGTGLGLSISQDLIREHNGYLHIESKINDHTAVTMDLPLQT